MSKTNRNEQQLNPPMIQAEKLSYGFPQKELFAKVSFTLEDGHHCAFIGTSGSGKSTLVDIIMDPEEYMYDGKLTIDPNCRIGYISQFSDFEYDDTTTVFEYIAEGFIALQQRLDAICTELETATFIDELLKDYQETLDAFDAVDGNDYESNINKKLNLANLNKLRDMPVAKLSGGEFKLVQVIKEMLTVPTLLIMDEPDVFLDFENTNALKDLINAHKGMLLVITHNRYLLNHCFNKVLHLEDKDIQEFEGTYPDYTFSLLQQKIEQQEQSVKDDEEIERNELLIHQLRVISSSNADESRGRALHARVKIQERLMANRIKAPFVDIKQPNIDFPTLDEVPTGLAVTLKELNISFNETLLKDVCLEINASDKFALIGANGSGKTTLLREIYKGENPAITIHEGVELAYLSQKNEEMLDVNRTIVDEALESGFNSLQAIRTHFAAYGFNDDISHQKIELLSGGEKNILQLAKVAATKANFLLLDEPTSHLDTYSQLALEKAIKAYKGGILMVSHDYYTIANCMDYVLLIEDKGIRRVSMRKFRKSIYEDHFDLDYLHLEEKRKALETQIELALQDTDFKKAKELCEDLAELIEANQK